MRLDRYSKSQLENRASQFFLRLQHTNPFPAMAEGIVPDVNDLVFSTYMSCLPHNIREAVLTLMADKRYIGFLDTNTASSLKVEVQHPEDPQKMIGVAIEFNFAKRRPSSINWGRKAEVTPDHPMLNEIIQWVYKSREINQTYGRCRSYINTIVEWANTAGQLNTMFPEYVHLLPEHQQQHISKMQKRSRLPKGADIDYLKQHRQFVAEKTALCLLLPQGGEKIWLG